MPSALPCCADAHGATNTCRGQLHLPSGMLHSSRISCTLCVHVPSACTEAGGGAHCQLQASMHVHRVRQAVRCLVRVQILFACQFLIASCNSAYVTQPSAAATAESQADSLDVTAAFAASSWIHLEGQAFERQCSLWDGLLRTELKPQCVPIWSVPLVVQSLLLTALVALPLEGFCDR